MKFRSLNVNSSDIGLTELLHCMSIIANENVMHSKTAIGHMQNFHTYIILKSFSSESEHSILWGGVPCQLNCPENQSLNSLLYIPI